MDRESIKQIVTKTLQSDPAGGSIKRVSLFGSFVHGNQSPDSDIDLIFETNEVMSLFDIGGIQYQLQTKLGKKVDFVPKESIIPQLKDRILSEAEVIYG